MKLFTGVAHAVYDSNPTKCTTTIVAGVTKDDIRMYQTNTFTLDDFSRPYVSAAYGSLEGAIREATGLGNDEAKIAVVTGTDGNVDIRNLLVPVTQVYGETEIENGLPIKRATQVAPTMDMDYLHTLFGMCVCAIAKVASDKDNLHVEPHRGYLCMKTESARVKSGGGIVVNGMDYLPKKFVDDLVADILLAEKSDKQATLRVVAHAKIFGEMASDFYKQRKRVTRDNWQNARYFSAPDELRSRMYLISGARQAYAKALMEGLNINYNICVKGMFDPKSPPFADVAAAVVADQMDEVTGDKPSLIMINHAS